MFCVIKKQIGDGVIILLFYKERKIIGCWCSVSVNNVVNEVDV